MKFEFSVVWCAFCVIGVRSFILIPEELPSILSIFYSNVPPIKKGTDSRIGIGFRLGPNADFQVQFEIGPQLNTQPIGPNAGMNQTTTSRKRQAQPSHHKINFNAANPSEKWLNTWRLNLNEDDNQIFKEGQLTSDPTRENLSYVGHLRQLYAMSNRTSK